MKSSYKGEKKAKSGIENRQKARKRMYKKKNEAITNKKQAKLHLQNASSDGSTNSSATPHPPLKQSSRRKPWRSMSRSEDGKRWMRCYTKACTNNIFRLTRSLIGSPKTRKRRYTTRHISPTLQRSKILHLRRI